MHETSAWVWIPARPSGVTNFIASSTMIILLVLKLRRLLLLGRLEARLVLGGYNNGRDVTSSNNMQLFKFSMSIVTTQFFNLMCHFCLSPSNMEVTTQFFNLMSHFYFPVTCRITTVTCVLTTVTCILTIETCIFISKT